MPSRKIEEQLELLSSLRNRHADAETEATIRKLLKNSAGIVVAKAASVVAHLLLKAAVPDLLPAYERLVENGAKQDPQCMGKLAIAKALKQFDYSDSAPFLRGLNYKQWEPAWGSEIDTAAGLRAECALALVACTDILRDAKLWQLMRALTDAEAVVRVEAARALEQMSGREGALLLRLKARMGDRDASVTGQVLQSVLEVEGSDAISFTTEFLFQKSWTEPDDELREVAALALGASRLPEALDTLVEAWRGSNRAELKAVLLRALSSSRQADALRFLTELVTEARLPDAQAALEALTLHRDSEAIRAAVLTAVRERNETDLTRLFHRNFPRPSSL